MCESAICQNSAPVFSALFTAKRIDFPRVFQRTGHGRKQKRHDSIVERRSRARFKGEFCAPTIRENRRARGKFKNRLTALHSRRAGRRFRRFPGFFFSGQLTGVAVVLQVVSGCALHNRIVEADRRGERHCSALAALSCPRRPRGPAHPNTHAGLLGYVSSRARIDAQTGRTS